MIDSNVSKRCMGYEIESQMFKEASSEVWGPRITRVFEINRIRFI